MTVKNYVARVVKISREPNDCDFVRIARVFKYREYYRRINHPEAKILANMVQKMFGRSG